MGKPTVAIVGRPNVGKSTLFNRLLGRRVAITDDQPGVTRDRLYRDADWAGRAYRLVDTGGYAAWDGATMSQLVTAAARVAMAEADALVLLVDAREGLTAADREIADLLRICGKPVFLAVNKVDSPSREGLAHEFFELGLGEPYPISAMHGGGISNLFDALMATLPPDELDEPGPVADACINVSIIGRPNVGKSTLLNHLLAEERSLVSAIPGTTRDPVDAIVHTEQGCFRLIDTAGIRRRGKQHGVEKWSVYRAEDAVERSDVCLLLMDAQDGLTATDLHVFSIVRKQFRAAVLVVNKWDLVEHTPKAAETFERVLRERAPFLAFAPVVTISAKTGLRTQRIFGLVRDAYQGYSQRVPTAELNRFLERILATKQPARVSGKAPNILYMTQAGTRPPTFVLFVSRPEALHFSYRRFLVNQLYAQFGFLGTPIRLVARRR